MNYLSDCLGQKVKFLKTASSQCSFHLQPSHPYKCFASLIHNYKILAEKSKKCCVSINYIYAPQQQHT